MYPVYERLLREVTDFERLQKTLIGFGAMDSEPEGVFQEYLWKVFEEGAGVQDISEDPEHWQLFVELKGCKSAAKRLAAACRRVIKLAVRMHAEPHSEYEKAKEWARNYCWRAA